MSKVSPIDSQSSAIRIVQAPQRLTTHHSQLNEVMSDLNRICKICLEEEITNLDLWVQMDQQQLKGNELMVPCECSGSVGFVHYKCIKTWIYKQIQKTGKKQAHCQICKAQIHFKMKKIKYCEFTLKNLALISGCNILTSIVEVFLLIVATMIFRYTLTLSDSNLVRYVLIVLISIISLAFSLTLIHMISQAFVKSKKDIGHIFSIQESQYLGLRETRSKTGIVLPKTSFNFPERHGVRMKGNGNRIANSHSFEKRKTTSKAHLVEINRTNTFSNM